MSNYTKIIEEWIKEDPSLTSVLMNIASELYRENGLQEIEYKGITFVKGDILFTDEKWDQLKQQTKFVEPLMNAQNRPKIKELYAFGTLKKFTEQTLEQYNKRINKIDGIEELVLLPKYDGVGMRVYYGEMFLTRYDKEYGLDISYKVKHLFNNLPKDAVLRGELITLKDHKNYASKRHYVSAMITNEQPIPDDIIFVCYEYIQNPPLTTEQMIRKIKTTTGFSHVARKVDKEYLSPEIIKEFFDLIPKEYEVDGVVIRPNEIGFNFEDKEEPSYEVAYKFESERYEGKIKEIEWSVKEEGYLEPTLVLEEPVIIDEQKIERATGVNFNYLFKHNLYPGEQCLVSHKIVPRIEGIVENENEDESEAESKAESKAEEFSETIMPQKCPNCGGKIVVDKDSVERFRCEQFYENRCFNLILLNRAKDCLKIKGIGEKGLIKLSKEKDFDFMEWVGKYNPTNKQLFLILSNKINNKKIDDIFNEEALNELLRLYKFK